MYVIVATPAETPVTTPLNEFTDAMDVLLDAQLEVVPVPVNVILEPTQTAEDPVIVGFGFTFIVTVFEHPVFVV